MPTHLGDPQSNIVGGVSVARATHTSSGNGSGVDLGVADGQAFAIIPTETVTDGVHTITFEESKNDNTADPEAADPYTAISPVTSRVVALTEDNLFLIVNFFRRKRYVRAVKTVSGTTTGAVYSVGVFGAKKFY